MTTKSTENTLATLSQADRMVELKDGTQIAVAAYGQGPRQLLALHAAGHASGDFSKLADLLGPEWSILAPDFPGHGRTQHQGVEPRAANYAKIVSELMDILGLKKPLVLGNSIGGAVAIHLAKERPDDIAGLVLCNPAGLMKIDIPSRVVIGAMVRFFEAGAKGRNWFGPMFRLYYGRAVLPCAPKRAEQIIGKGYDLAPQLAETWRGFAEPQADLRPIAATLDVPVWFAWAKKDKFVAWSRSKKAALRRSRAKSELPFRCAAKIGCGTKSPTTIVERNEQDCIAVSLVTI